MKNISIALAIVAVLVGMVSNVLCADDLSPIMTDGLQNGRGFYSDDQDIVDSTIYYTRGCIDTSFYMNRDLMFSIYPDTATGDIVEAIKNFYDDNPTQHGRQIVDVLLSGCK